MAAKVYNFYNIYNFFFLKLKQLKQIYFFNKITHFLIYAKQSNFLFLKFFKNKNIKNTNLSIKKNNFF